MLSTIYSTSKISKFQNYKGKLEKLHQTLKKCTFLSTRSSFSPKNIQVPSTDVFQKKCILSSQTVKKDNNITLSLISVAIKFEENIQTYARWLDDNKLLLQLGNPDFVSKEIMYHGVCHVNYQNKAGWTDMAMR